MWLVLESTGEFPDALQALWPKAFREWFPANPYQSALGPEMVLTEHFDEEQTRGRYEPWIPVEKARRIRAALPPSPDERRRPRLMSSTSAGGAIGAFRGGSSSRRSPWESRLFDHTSGAQ